MNQTLTTTSGTTVLPWMTVRASLFQLLLIGLTLLLPAVAHLVGAPVRWLLPMHWPVILAGLVYGWRGGLLVGLSAPAVNYLITGHPLPLVLLGMTLELGTYGGMVGFLREIIKINAFFASAVALITGRIIFLGVMLSVGSWDGNFAAYALPAMIPGLPGGAAMTLTLPWLARWWVGRSSE